MPDKAAQTRQDALAGKRVWKVRSETKDELIRFQRDVVLPLRKLSAEGAFRIEEHSEQYRGARFVVRVEISEPACEAKDENQ